MNPRNGRFRCGLWVACVAVALAPLVTAAGTAPLAQDVTISTITPDEGRYYNGWPTVARQPNGTLIVAWSGGRDAHVCPFGRVESMVSHDDGKTWGWPRVLLDTAIDDRDAGILVTARGTLLVTTFGSVGYDAREKRAKYAQQMEKWERFDRGVHAPDFATEATSQLLRSEDGGRTWSAPQRIPVSSPHGPLQLADGRLLFPGVNRLDRPGERSLGAWESRDDGRSWTLLSVIPARPGENVINYHELHGVEATDGTIVVLIRSHADEANRQMLQTESKDGGRSWSEPRALGLFGYPPHLVRLRDGRLLLSYDQRRAPYGVQAKVSSDHGATWSDPIILTSNAVKLDQGYPSTVELGDGSLLTVWYEVALGTKKAVLKQAKWKLHSRP